MRRGTGMNPIRSGKRTIQRGAVLISALAFSVVISLIVAGIATFTMAHFQRATSEGDYASALNMAECGINWEIQYISIYGVSSDTPGSPHPGTVGTVGSYSVFITNELDPGDGSLGVWAAPNPATIWGTGTVNGITASVKRMVNIKAKRKSIFDEYALYGITGSTFSGNYTIDGTYGAGGSVGASGNSSVIYGNFIFNGYPSGSYGGPLGWVGGGASPAYGPNGAVSHQPDAIPWPYVDQLADVMATKKAVSLGLTPPSPGGGIAWFKAHNDNNLIQVFGPLDANNTTDPTQRDSAPPSGGLTPEIHGGLTYWVLNNVTKNPGNIDVGWGQATTDSNVMDSSANGTQRYVFPPTTWPYSNPSNSFSIAAIGIKNMSVIILPGSGSATVYRDYYFENITQTGSQAILVDIARGPVRVWLNASDSYYASSDDILKTWIFTTNITSPIVTSTADPSRFRIFSNKGVASGGGSKGVIALSGSNFFPGGIYDYNRQGTPPGSNSQVQFGGGSVIFGSVIAGSFGGNGNPLIKFPNLAISDSLSDWSLWWGFKGGWTEVNGAN